MLCRVQKHSWTAREPVSCRNLTSQQSGGRGSRQPSWCTEG